MHGWLFGFVIGEAVAAFVIVLLFPVIYRYFHRRAK